MDPDDTPLTDDKFPFWMDAQQQHDLQLQKAELRKGSRERVEDLLRVKEKSSPPSTLDPLGAAAARTGATREELVKMAEEFGF